MVEITLTIFVVIIFGGIVAFGVSRAPFIAEPYKSWAIWLIGFVVLVVVAILLVMLLRASGLTVL